jgi:hypothetical protein
VVEPTRRIEATSETDANGDLITDTILDLSNGETIVLSGVTGVTDPDDLSTVVAQVTEVAQAVADDFFAGL